MVTKSKSRVSRIPFEELESAGLPQLARWLTQQHDESWRQSKTLFFSYSSTSIAAAQLSAYVMDVPGVVPDDHVEVSHQVLPNNIGIVGAHCSTSGLVKVKMINYSTGPLTVPSQVFKIKTTRF